jgi:protein-S-isoprenylcysteine O-methyltransferase Ste14
VLRLRNFFASVSLIAAVAAIYAATPYFRDFFSSDTHFLGVTIARSDVLFLAGAVYMLLLLLFYLLEPAPRISKSILCLRGLKRLAANPTLLWRGGLPREERVGLLSILLKGFFAPLMAVSLLYYSGQLLAHGGGILSQWGQPDLDWLALFNAHGFWFVFMLIFTLDVFFYALGYLTEAPALKNEIRSVDPTLLGWAVVLACYPPLNLFAGMVFGGGYYEDFPQFELPAMHVMVNSLLLALLAVYAWSAVALNFKASNLTHRGIISHGPYRYFRHPAYTSKVLAWWIGMIPPLYVAAQSSLWTALLMTGSMVGWSVIYYFRAVTEEDHLRSVDDEYDAYCQKVKYRFIPGVI